MAWRIPHSLDWPFGWTVTVSQVEPGDARLEGQNGTWDVDARAIYIDRSLTPAEKRYVLLHERDHAETDWKLWLGQSVPVKAPQGPDPDPHEEDDMADEGETHNAH